MSESVRAILRNALALLLAYVIPRSLMLVAVAVAARVLGAHAFGVYGTAAAFAVILSIVSTLGMQPLLVRELARAPERAAGLLRTAHVLKTASNAVMLVLLLALGAALGLDRTVLATALVIGAGYALGSYSENLAAYFQSQERMHVWTQASALFGLVAGLGGAAIVIATRSITAFAAAALLGQLAALAWLMLRARRAVPEHALPPHPFTSPETAAELRLLGRAVVPFALAFIALTLYCKVDVLLLARWRSATDVGLYTAAYKFVDLTQALVIVAAGAVLPRLARAMGPASGRAGALTVELTTLGVLPFAVLLFIARAPIVALIFGAEYAAATSAVALLAALLPLLALNITAGYVLGVAGRMRAVAVAYAGALALKVVLGFVLIPRLGPAGAAGAALIAELTLAPMLIYALARAGAPVGARTLDRWRSDGRDAVATHGTA